MIDATVAVTETVVMAVEIVVEIVAVVEHIVVEHIAVHILAVEIVVVENADCSAVFHLLLLREDQTNSYSNCIESILILILNRY